MEVDKILDPLCDLELYFSRSNFEKAVSQEWDGQHGIKEKCVYRTHFVTLNFDLNHDIGFSMSDFEKTVSEMGWNEG